MNSKPLWDNNSEAGATWASLSKVARQCDLYITGEMNCDLVKGPAHPDCQNYFLRNEDCYQQVLCHSQWTEALYCLKDKSKEACADLIQKSRSCKNDFFEHMLSEQLENHLKQIHKAEIECEEVSVRHENCLSVLGSNDPECLEREYIRTQCTNSKIIPADLWHDWKMCEKAVGHLDSYDLCTDELEEIILATSARAANICLSVPGVHKKQLQEFGGPSNTLAMMHKVVYGSHYKNLFKDYDPRSSIFAAPKIPNVTE